MVMIPVLLVCCSSLLIASLTLLDCGENLTRPEPKVGEAGPSSTPDCCGIRLDLSS